MWRTTATVAARLHPNHMMQGPPKNSYPTWLWLRILTSPCSTQRGYSNATGDGLSFHESMHTCKHTHTHTHIRFSLISAGIFRACLRKLEMCDVN